jgi:hypothetical protein
VGDLLLLLSIAVALRALGLARVERVLGLVPARRSANRSASAEPLARRVERAALRSPVAVRCLARAVCLRWLLERHGIAARLRIGATLAGGAFRAHAWVEVDGQVVGDEAENVARYTAFAS